MNKQAKKPDPSKILELSMKTDDVIKSTWHISIGLWFITDDGSSSTEVPNTIKKSCTVSRRPAPLALILRCHVKLFTTCLQSLLLCTYEETVRVHVTSWQNDAAVKLLSYDVCFSCRENDGCSFYTWTSEFFHSLLKEYSRIFFGFLPHLIWSKFHFAHLQG